MGRRTPPPADEGIDRRTFLKRTVQAAATAPLVAKELMSSDDLIDQGYTEAGGFAVPTPDPVYSFDGDTDTGFYRRETIEVTAFGDDTRRFIPGPLIEPPDVGRTETK